MNTSTEPKMSGTFEQLNASANPPVLPVKEPGHPCSGEGRCCGRCRNPKRPVATLAPDTENNLQPASKSNPLPDSNP